jgi:ferric iron reductase protein FhuF
MAKVGTTLLAGALRMLMMSLRAAREICQQAFYANVGALIEWPKRPSIF